MSYIRWFSEIGVADVPSVGGKNASLGEMVGELAPQGVRVPNGFAITAAAYRHVLDQADAWRRLHKALNELDARNVDDLARRAQLAPMAWARTWCRALLTPTSSTSSNPPSARTTAWCSGASSGARKSAWCMQRAPVARPPAT